VGFVYEHAEVSTLMWIRLSELNMYMDPGVWC
jgi:hypothetical protein